MHGSDEGLRLVLPPLKQARVAGEFAEVAVRTARELGADLSALGEACGLGDLGAPLPESIGVESFLGILNSASAMLEDPVFGLHVGERIRIADIGGYGMALMACPTLRETIALTLRYECLAHDLSRSELIEIDGVARFRLHTSWLDLKGAHHLVQFMAAHIRGVVNWLAGVVLPIDCFNFTHARPADRALEEYRRVLGAPMNFGAAQNEGVFAAMLIDAPIPNADPSILPRLMRLIDERLAQRGALAESAAHSELRAMIRAHMLAGRIRLEEVAAAADMSVRTLQRRLSDNGCSFTSLLDDIRRETAQQLLLDRQQTLADVALLLGFSEQSSFNHAFRRWCGVSPSQWRRGA